VGSPIWKTAGEYLSGNVDETYPECKRCHELMEREEGFAPDAYCLTCTCAAADEMAKEILRHRMIFSFIGLMGLTAVQTAIGPLDEIRRKMLWEMKMAASHGEVPEWYIKQWEEESKDLLKADAMSDNTKAMVNASDDTLKRLYKDSEMLRLYQLTLKAQLGHIVDVLKAGDEWRKGGSPEALAAAIDAALKVEAERGG
jgi:hypothetical protein